MTTITNPWEPVPPLHAIAERAHRERIAHEKEQLRLLVLIDQWDRLSAEQKWAEYDIEANTDGRKVSRFHEVPGFDPKWCAACQSSVFLSYLDDPAGVCPFDGLVLAS